MTSRPETRIVSALMLSLVLAASLLLAGCATTTTKPSESKVLTVEEILQMSKNKVPSNDIIKKITESGTVYRLTASQLADLRQSGVADPIINYMQQTYLEAVRKDQSREDQRHYTAYGGYLYGGPPCGW